MRKIFLSAGVIVSFVFASCETGDTLLDQEPQGQVSSEQIEEVIRDYPERALTILGGAESGNTNFMHSSGTSGLNVTDHSDFGYMSLLLGLDHMTNDLVMMNSHWFTEYYEYRAREVQLTRGNRMIWNFEYKVIYNMNSILSSLIGESSDADANALKGRVLAIRANAYMDLIRTYAIGDQGIPYYSSGDEEIDHPSRMSTTEVWGRIIDDLNKAYSLLEGYSSLSKEMVSDQVVAGMLARAYLFNKDYSNAAKYANLARAGYSPMSEQGLMDGFQFISNDNWMWGADITGATSTIFASFFSHMDNTNAGYAGALGIYRGADVRFYNRIPDTDIRKKWFLAEAKDGLPALAHLKFRDNTSFEGDYIYMRADEFYLIEAEALAHVNEGESRSLLEEFVKTRDKEFTASGLSGAALLDEIHFQRRLELWGEGGQWWEMKRLGVDLERDYEGTNHPRFGRFNHSANSDKFYYEIPQDELNGNSEVTNP